MFKLNSIKVNTRFFSIVCIRILQNQFETSKIVQQLIIKLNSRKSIDTIERCIILHDNTLNLPVVARQPHPDPNYAQHTAARRVAGA